MARVAFSSTMFFGAGIMVGSAMTGGSGWSLPGMVLGMLLMAASFMMFFVYAYNFYKPRE